MTVDPKYSDLPWIAHDQPDVFESTFEALPESDQAVALANQTELNSESLTHIKLDANATREQFQSKQVRATTDRVDFSDRITASRRTGYIAFDAEEYSAAGEGPDDEGKESLMARFQRLQCEIAQMVAEVEAAKKEVSGATGSGADGLSSAACVTTMAAGVCRQLTDAHLQRLLGDDLRSVEARAEAMTGSHSRMIQQVEAQKSKKMPDPVSGKDPRGSQVVYEMYTSVDKIKNMEQAKFTDCEQRLQRLEALVGPTPPLPRFSLDSGPVGPRPLVDAASRLNSRASALCEGSFLEQMETRLGAVHAKLGQITQKKEAVTAADTENKVAELYEIVKKWDCMAPVVPQLVDRLEAIKTLHEQAMQFSQSISYIDKNQKEVNELLKKHKDTVKKLETALSTNLAKVQASCDAVGKRVKTVK